jgi:hypothetical protein
MRISLRPLLASVLVFSALLAYGQSGKVSVQSVDVGEYKATIVIVNDSPKDVTHYSVSIDDISLGNASVHAVYYNFARIHQTLRITPAMASGLSNHVWSREEIVMMADGYAPKPAPLGPYKKRDMEGNTIYGRTK